MKKIQRHRRAIAQLVILLLCGVILCSCSVAQGESLATQDAFDRVVNQGWITKEEFRSDLILTRRQAILSILRMAKSLPGNLPTEAGHLPQFQDTRDDREKDLFLQARNCGIIQGGNANKFFPNKQLLRMDCITWLDRTFDLPDTVDFQNNKIKDNDRRTDPDAYFAINKYLAYKVIAPDGTGRFHPKATLTVGQFAEILDRLSQVEGVKVRNLTLVQYEGQPQKQKIIDPAGR